MPRYFLKLSFDGTNYHGWQAQDNAITVQAEIEKAISQLLQEKIEITGAGRTDAGVHAREFYAHFDTSFSFDNETLNKTVYSLNAILPEDISINTVIPVNSLAHARFSAISRTYKYYISRNKNPFENKHSWCVHGNLNIKLMNAACEILYKHIDFTSFSKLHTDVNNNNCKIFLANWNEENNILVFTITANRFLRNMVRAIVGTLIDVGKSKITLDEFRTIIENKNRCDAGYSVPAKGLFLEKIDYPPEIFD
ncbi:MAG: tRNA pseudouridine(38-40) synthase TruA [Bacteroidetes bacterium]|nr:tRNA pseudouridine(38-40) synthase TruA [Bacteroidota bacterium]